MYASAYSRPYQHHFACELYLLAICKTKHHLTLVLPSLFPKQNEDTDNAGDGAFHLCSLV